MKKTQQQIDGEIAKLTEIKPKVLRRSHFGDDHHAAIDAQVDVMQRKLTNDSIYDRYSPDPDNEDDDRPQNVLDAAIEAREWMDGNRDEDLSDEWKELVQQ